MNHPPAFQFYAGDWLSSTKVLLMTPEQRGGYIFLLCHQWNNWNERGIPDDDKTLAVLSGLNGRWLQDSNNTAIRQCFVSCENIKYIRNEKLEAVRDELLKNRAANSRGGTEAMKRRYGKDKLVISDLQVGNKSSSSSSSSTTNSKKPLNTLSENSDCMNIFEHWNTCPQLIKHRKLGEDMKRKMAISLKKLTGNGLNTPDILNAITNYNTVLGDSGTYYFTHKWTLPDFLTRGCERFLDAAKPIENFQHSRPGTPAGREINENDAGSFYKEFK